MPQAPVENDDIGQHCLGFRHVLKAIIKHNEHFNLANKNTIESCPSVDNIIKKLFSTILLFPFGLTIYNYSVTKQVQFSFISILLNLSESNKGEDGEVGSTFRKKGICSAANKQWSADTQGGSKVMRQQNLAAKPGGGRERKWGGQWLLPCVHCQMPWNTSYRHLFC